MSTDPWKDLRAFFLSVETQAWSAQSLQDALQTVLNQITLLLDADRMSLIVFNELRTGLDFYLRSGPGQDLVDLHVSAQEMLSGLSGWVITTRQSALSSQFQPDPRESEAVQRRRAETQAGSILVVPLLFGQRLLGTMTAINRPGQRDFQEQDQQLLEFVSDYSGNLITHVRLLLELKKAKEEAETADQIKTQILANLSHELRTPLFTLMGFTELLKGTNPSETQKDYLEALESAETHLANLINGLLDLAKAEARELHLELENLTLEPFIQTLLSAWANTANTKGLTFKVKLSGALPTSLQIDKQRLRQILDILLDNAVKFTSVGTIQIEFSQSVRHDGLPELLTTVSDTGIGLSEEMQQTLFLPFRQVDGSSRRSYGGLGLGLALAQELVQLLGGNLSVKSQEGKGSEFAIRLPFLPIESRPLVKLDQRPHVLFIEDDPLLVLALQKAGEQLGLRFVLTSSLTSAKEEVKKNSFQVIFLGLSLPLTPKLAAIHQLKTARSSTAPHCVLLLDYTEVDREQLLRLGLEVLPRPTSAAHLQEYFLKKPAEVM